jgi:hypothetical protein
MKNETMAAIRNYRDLAAQVQAELQKIDPGLRDNIREQRENQVREKYQQHMDALMLKIKAGREYFKAARLREADPMKALIKKAWRADDNKPGMAAVCAALETMSPEAQLELAKEFNHPVLSLQAVANVKKLDLEPIDRLNLEPAVAELTAGAVDMVKIRDHAQTELACVEVEAEINRESGGDPVERLGMWHDSEALKKIIATGKLPKSERISALSHPDPLERMRAARKDGGDAEVA